MRTLVGMLLAGVVLVGSGCATTMEERKLPPADVNVTGNWTGTWAYDRQSMGQGNMAGTFTQDGDKLTGTFNVYGTGGRVAYVVGFVTGHTVRLSQPLLGTLTVSTDGKQMKGDIQGLDTAHVTLTKQ
jgi:hypothetical protein